MMISPEMNAKLNEQITAELSAAHQYLAMACAFDGMGYRILAKRFLSQQEEERSHAMKILKYVQDAGGSVTLEGLAKPATSFSSVEEIVEKALQSEQEIAKRIHGLVALAEAEKDYATRSFLNWFVDEQVEEVAQMTDLRNLIRLADGHILQVEARVRHEMMSH